LLGKLLELITIVDATVGQLARKIK